MYYMMIDCHIVTYMIFIIYIYKYIHNVSISIIFFTLSHFFPREISFLVLHQVSTWTRSLRCLGARSGRFRLRVWWIGGGGGEVEKKIMEK